MSYFLRSEL